MHPLTDQLAVTTETRFAEDWKRQRRTAEDILHRLQDQEGVLLADQVGMGKTYVALAVATSTILRTPQREQVVVFVPPAVAHKWVAEWEKFSEQLLPDGHEIRCVAEPLRSGEALLKALDDPPERRRHLIVVTHTALTSTLKDPFVQLALLHYATRRRTGADALRRRIAKWSEGRAGLLRDSRFTTVLVERLLASPPERWAEVWAQGGGAPLEDDPVPATVVAAVEQLDLSWMREVIDSLPVNRSADIRRRLKVVRDGLAEATQATWKEVLARIDLHLPLLIVDEAHRLKNNWTQISGLFAESTEDHDGGALAGVFDRMVFMTATPFELGHAELVNVLSRLGAVRWQRGFPAAPLEERLTELARVLAEAQRAALAFDREWGQLEAEDLAFFDAWSLEEPVPVEASAVTRRVWRDAQAAVLARKAMHREVRKWVIRHERPRRRTYMPGQSILEGGSTTRGLEIPGDAALPFLLAARAQAIADEDEHGGTRPLFAYGIASSYEAFLRLGTGDSRDADSEEAPAPADTPASAAVDWYREEIDRLLTDETTRAAHPKVQATVEQAFHLWQRGEKCLVFCWYVRTGAAVEHALSQRVERWIAANAQKAFGSADREQATLQLKTLSENVLRTDSRTHQRLRAQLDETLYVPGMPRERLEVLVEVAIRNVRSAAFLARFTRLASDLDYQALWRGVGGDNPAGVNVLARWRAYAERVATMSLSEWERVGVAMTGASDTDSAAGTGRRSGMSLGTVRRAYGQTDRGTRERLTAAFNTPFAPDLLVASSVMGEGIDLHQECRFVIHHDLDWNPSVLEQRTGRLDRIGSLAERLQGDIEVFEPYLAGTHDEKMYRVVKDRAGWFDIVMGRAVRMDEYVTDMEERRFPLREPIKRALTMDLRSPET
ncbi:helicase-related protein [Dermacoccaceae bacterium W4C1]